MVHYSRHDLNIRLKVGFSGAFLHTQDLKTDEVDSFSAKSTYWLCAAIWILEIKSCNQTFPVIGRRVSKSPLYFFKF